MLNIRPARKSEKREIISLIHAVGINPFGLNWKRFVVAVDETDQMMGCAQLKPHQGAVWELASLAVKSEFRGQGTARAIITHLISISENDLYLTCRSGLVPFYKKFDFNIVVTFDSMPGYFRWVAYLSVWIKKINSSFEGITIMHHKKQIKKPINILKP